MPESGVLFDELEKARPGIRPVSPDPLARAGYRGDE